MTKNKFLPVLVLFICLLILGCQEQQQISDMQLRQMQAKDLQGSYDDAYRAVIQVFQDYGYVIKNSDYKSGVIQGESGFKKDKNFFWNSKMNNSEATATLEQFGPDIVKIRISLIKRCKVLGYYNYENTEKITDIPLYQKLYDDIQKEVFVRKNINL